MSKSDNLQLTYLQQFKRYLLPLVPLPLKTRPQLYWSPQPLLPKYNPVPLLEAQACQEEEALQEEEEVHPEEEEARPVEEEEEEIPHKLLLAMESPWVCYPPYLREITQKLRVFSKSFPLTSLSIMTSQHSPHSLNESQLPSLASRDLRSIDGHNNNSNGWWHYNQPTTLTPCINNLSQIFMPASWILKRCSKRELNCKH